VHFLGSLDHTLLPVVLSAADAMVLPSVSEGLANAWVEALACGCPLVISDAGGATELMTRPQAGRIVERDAGAIAQAVNALLADPPDRAAVAATVDRFSWPAHAEGLAEIYSQVIGQ
jgi:glycosyltransferase involved in cell wall biosynthesis